MEAWVKIVIGLFLALVALKGYGLARELQGASRGRAEVTQAVTKKADANAATGERVGAAAEAGKGRAKNPYTRAE